MAQVNQGGFLRDTASGDGSLGAIVVAGSVTSSGGATEATLDTRTGSLTETAPATDTASSGINGRLQRIAQRITSLIALLPASLGQKTMDNSFAVTVASDQSLPTTSVPLTSASVTRVSASATVVDLKASNTARRGLYVFNELLSAVLYIKLGSAATLTDYTLSVPPGGYYELPLPVYTGVVTGIWASAAGAAQVTEGV